jgi:hypothetical protein
MDQQQGQRRDIFSLDTLDLLLIVGLGVASVGLYAYFGWPSVAVAVGGVMIILAIARALRSPRSGGG